MRDLTPTQSTNHRLITATTIRSTRKVQLRLPLLAILQLLMCVYDPLTMIRSPQRRIVHIELQVLLQVLQLPVLLEAQQRYCCDCRCR